MTANWPAAVINVLIAAFFLLAILGIGLGAYAADALKKAEGRAEATPEVKPEVVREESAPAES